MAVRSSLDVPLLRIEMRGIRLGMSPGMKDTEEQEPKSIKVHLTNPVFGRVEKPLSKLSGGDFLATVPQCSASFAISIGSRKRGISLLSGRTQAFARILSARPTKPCFPALIYLVACDAHANHANSGLYEDRIIAALDLQHPIERVPYTALRDSLCLSMLVNHP